MATTQTQAQARLRLTRRGRAAVAALALGVAGAGGVVGAGVPAALAGGPAPAVEVVDHTVAPGETLWDIARGLVTPGQDVRDVVETVRELNGMAGSGLRAGQQLLVPAS